MLSLPFVGAYVASPSNHLPWDRQAESEFFAGLRAEKAIGGLELPFYGSLHRFDVEWFLGALKPDWEFTLTSIPGTMEQLKANPEFGLASDTKAGREAALSFLKGARDSIGQLNRFFGRKTVRALVVHSAPKRTTLCDRDKATLALQESLAELLRWDWDGAEIWLEHCDAFAAAPGLTHAPGKGFLPLDCELAAINTFAGKIGVVINWARSAIEARDCEAPLRHLEQARPFLRAAVLSGCSVGHAVYGDWADTHAPIGSESGFLLTADQARAFLAAAGNCMHGLKIQPLPRSVGVAERLRVVHDALGSLWASAPGA